MLYNTKRGLMDSIWFKPYCCAKICGKPAAKIPADIEGSNHIIKIEYTISTFLLPSLSA